MLFNMSSNLHFPSRYLILLFPFLFPFFACPSNLYLFSTLSLLIFSFASSHLLFFPLPPLLHYFSSPSFASPSLIIFLLSLSLSYLLSPSPNFLFLCLLPLSLLSHGYFCIGFFLPFLSPLITLPSLSLSLSLRLLFPSALPFHRGIKVT